ncbi:hypothetical protein [Moorena sp. SIO4E2]|uniref:hypothetical protein n=1 Tax=Moorena sp. SIO4E2 TaxID=2607826 RepID=UPI00257DBFB6|nr:hypothetical protein [Moorena sp. SIO4E2]
MKVEGWRLEVGGLKVGGWRLEVWRVGGVEVGGLEGWRVGGLEGWRVGGLEGWRVGGWRLEVGGCSALAFFVGKVLRLNFLRLNLLSLEEYGNDKTI